MENNFFRLSNEELAALNMVYGDILYIAPSWDIKPDQVQAACQSMNGSFTFTLSQCEATVMVRI